MNKFPDLHGALEAQIGHGGLVTHKISGNKGALLRLSGPNCGLLGSRIHDWAKRWAPGLVNFVAAVAYHFCLSLPAAFTQPGAAFKASPVHMLKHGAVHTV